MDLLKRFMMLVVVVLTMLHAARANAQSDVRTADQKIYFPQMDPVLTGMWEGHGGLEGMKYDPQAIACMAQACAAIQATVPRNPDRCNGNQDQNCRFQEVRDGNNSRYQSCHAAHLARTRQPGYARMANPPQLTSLVCSAIGALRNSSDDAIYAAVNGHARPQPAAYQPPTAKAPARQRLQPGESDMLMAQLRGLTADSKPVTRSRPRTAQVSRPQVVQPVASPVAYSGGISGFELLKVTDREAVLRILPGASFYTLQRSFLARDFVTESIPVMTYKRDGQIGTGNDRAQIFFPFIIRKGKIELYQPRMQLKANDYNGRLGSINAETLAFMDSCKDGGCEARFALQAGEIIRLPRKSLSNDAVSSNDNAPPVTAQPDKAPEKPDMELPEPASSAMSSIAAIPSAPTTTEPEMVSATPSSTGSAIPSASSSVVEPKAERPKDDRPAANRPDIPFWIVILTLVCGLAFCAYRLHGIWMRNAPNLTVNANSINPPSIQVTGRQKAPETTGSGPAASAGIKPVVSTTIPSPGPAPDPNIQSKTGGSPPSAQKRSPLLLPGAIGPTEPTIITYRGPEPQQSEPANPGDAGNAPEDPLHTKPVSNSS
ncbi:MAG: hypothetical protein WC551_04090 [Patescibacteria group bacterium]